MAADDSEANNTTMERINKLKSFLEDLDDSDEKRDENKRKFNDDVESLLQGQINSHTNDFLEETILHVAARKGIVWAAKILLEKEANALTTTSYGDTPFHMAAANGYTEMVELFLNENKPCPVNVTTRARWEMTALHRAAWDGRDETIEFLVRAGAEVDAKDIDGWTPLMAATQGRCLSSMEVLLDNGGHDQMNIPDNEGKTPLFVAIEDENLEGMHILLDYMPDKNKCDTDVYQRLLSYEASDLEDGRLDMQKCIQQTILDALEKDREAFDGALLWAAAKFERHEIAKTLLIRGRGTAEQQPLSESSVIELATQQRKLDILWWLVATSPRNSKIMANIKKAKDRAKSLKQAQETTTRDAHRESESRHKNKSKSGEDSGVTEAPTGINETSIRRHIIDILQYPPIAQEYEDSATLDPPRLKPQHSKSVNEFEATIAQFYNSKQISGITQRTRDLKDVIYGKGPKSIMADAISDLKKIMGKRFEDKEESPSSRRFRATYNEDDLAFTYIHLPATNMVWMKDLLLKVMADEKIEKGTARYHQASSFLQSTWFEIPDQISESRFMRPQFTERVQTASASKRQNEGSPPKRGGNQKGTTTNEVGQGQNVTKETEDSKPDPEDTNKKDVIKSKEQRDDNFIPSSALYMPFLSFATQEEERGGSGHVPWALTKLEQQLIILREDYKKSVVHSSATLDEAYYHFNLEDTPTVEERDRRNRNQVVTKQLDSEPKDPRQPRVEPWPLLRVNQIWIWTINDKWVISATSHPVDDIEQSWLDGFTEHLNKRIEAGGAPSQPESTEGMMKTIVNYCIGSYDRRRTFRNPNDEWKTGLSIRQLFSNYINSIGRKETDLFAKFQELQNGVDTDGRKKKFKEATVEAEQLFGELKDVRDELGIIKSIVGYQKVVQRKLFEKSSTGSSLSTDYIADDIAEMEKLAGRIQSAVDSTLSLLQSEIANFQTEQSVKQGTNMMAFTSITAVFLPLSFLTSLFALDVQSFEKAPVWAFKVIFGVSFPFAALVIYALFCHPYIMVNAKRIRKYPKKQYERIKKQYERIKKEYDEDKGRDDEHKEQDDEYIKKRYSEYIKPYIWHIKKRYTKFH